MILVITFMMSICALASSPDESEKLSRTVSYSVARQTQEFTVEGELTSNPGYLTHTIRSGRYTEPAKPAVIIIIKSAVEDKLKPMNGEREIQKAIESNKGEMKRLSSGADVKTSSKYKTTLANGEMVTVYPFRKVPNTYRGNYVFASYMLDDNTAVTVSSTHDKIEFDDLLKTLKIGELT
jgi:hypothetical protein